MKVELREVIELLDPAASDRTTHRDERSMERLRLLQAALMRFDTDRSETRRLLQRHLTAVDTSRESYLFLSINYDYSVAATLIQLVSDNDLLETWLAFHLRHGLLSEVQATLARLPGRRLTLEEANRALDAAIKHSHGNEAEWVRVRRFGDLHLPPDRQDELQRRIDRADRRLRHSID